MKREAVGKAKEGLRRGLCASLGVELVTLPVILAFFYEIPVYAPLLNLFVLPLMAPLLTAGVLCIVLGFILPGAAWIPARFCLALLRLTEAAALATGRLPGALLVAGRPGNWQIAVYYAGLLGLLLVWEQSAGKKKGPGRPYCIVWVFLLAILLVRPEPEFSLTMLDVGQGDAIYFARRNGSTFLMDAGSTSEKQVGRYILEPFFKYHGKKRVDYVLVSHLDEDHVSGIREILEEQLLDVGCLILPDVTEQDGSRETAWLEIKELAEQKGVPVRIMGRGDLLREGGLSIRCLGPEHGGSYESRNAGSLTLSLEYKELRVLLTGDLEGSGEEQTLREGFPCGSYDILKTAHHGSAYSTKENWLKAVRPSAALISCGEGNSYGHPHPELIERLRQNGVRIYQTPQGGAILVRSDGKTYRIRSFQT